MIAEDLIKRIDKLEMLFAEQEYGVESLNQVVTRQAQDIDALGQSIDHLKKQIEDLKQMAPDNAVWEEKPPHY